MRVAVHTMSVGFCALGCGLILGLKAGAGGAAVPDDSAPSQAKNQAVAAELKKFQGTWQLVSAETDGKTMPEEQVKQIRVIIEGDHHTVTFDGKVVAENVKFTVDPTTMPKSTEDTLEQEPHKGKKIRGIYLLEGDKLTSCVGAIDAPRPTEFASKPGSGQSLRRFQRVSDAALAHEKATAKEYQAFEGSWRFDSIQAGGNDLPADSLKTSRLICKGRDFTAVSPEGTDHGTFSVDVSKSPKTIDVTFTEGANKGQTLRGIYVLKDDTYKVCMAVPGKDRPKAFETKPDSGHVLEVLKREKNRATPTPTQ
ncbi:MAG: TIGR03067 domain-containing protein [Isosphaerales bacterium]